MPALESDHVTLVFCFCVKDKVESRGFNFECMWLSNDVCKNVTFTKTYVYFSSLSLTISPLSTHPALETLSAKCSLEESPKDKGVFLCRFFTLKREEKTNAKKIMHGL